MKECEQVEKTRQRMAGERARLMSARFGPAGVAAPMGLAGLGPSMSNNNTGTGRQQIMSPSASQPSVSGYSNNQPIHPHMPFVPRQSMLGLGPRMPLTSIQSSSSAPNAMFNAAGTAQPTLNHPMLRPVPGTSSGLGWKKTCRFGVYGYSFWSLLSALQLKVVDNIDDIHDQSASHSFLVFFFSI